MRCEKRCISLPAARTGVSSRTAFATVPVASVEQPHDRAGRCALPGSVRTVTGYAMYGHARIGAVHVEAREHLGEHAAAPEPEAFLAKLRSDHEVNEGRGSGRQHCTLLQQEICRNGKGKCCKFLLDIACRRPALQSVRHDTQRPGVSGRWRSSSRASRPSPGTEVCGAPEPGMTPPPLPWIQSRYRAWPHA